MVEFLQNWALKIALAALCGGLVWLLSPNGAVQKALRTLAAVFILTAFLQPFFSKPDFLSEFDNVSETQTAPNIPELGTAVQEQLRTTVENQIKEQLKSILARYEIKSGQILVETDILSDNSINIGTVAVQIPKSAAGQATQITAAAETELGLPVTIQYID